MKKILPTAAVILFTVVITAISEELPKAWLHAGNRPADYEISVDRKVSHDGKASASLKSIADKTEGFGTLMQTFKADAYRGRRIKMTAFVKSENVSGWAGLWMRVDGPMLAEAKMPEPLAFDNMEQRPIKGTTDWKAYEIVVDVPERSQEIAFGILLTGKGQVWLDDVSIMETVRTDVATVGPYPVNLGFEE